MAKTKKGIYYPNDYSQLADVPEDMKKMAESIDKAFDDNEYDDTKIKEDIENIGLEQTTQNEQIEENTDNITDLQEKTQELIDQIPEGTAEGTFITLNDSSDLDFVDFVVEGDTEQEEGATPETPKDVQVFTGNVEVKVVRKNVFDGEIEVGNMSDDGAYNNVNPRRLRSKNYIPVEPNTTYTMTTGYSNPSLSNGAVLIRFYANSKYGEEQLSQEKNYGGLNRSFITPDNCHAIRLLYTFGEVNLSPTDIQYVQIEKNSTATEYEPYQEQTQLLSLGDIELCKIEDLKDCIEENIDDWYKNEKVQKYQLTGNETIAVPTTPVSDGISAYRIILPSSMMNKEYCMGYSNRFRFVTNSSEWLANTDSQSMVLVKFNSQVAMYIRIKTELAPNIASLREYFKNNETIVYYPKASADKIPITDPTLISQLNELKKLHTYKGTTNIYTVTEGLNPILKVTYKKNRSEQNMETLSLDDLNYSTVINNLSDFPCRIGTLGNKTGRDYAGIIFSTMSLPKDSKIEFNGDMEIFQWAVEEMGASNKGDIETSNKCLVESGWINTKEYTTTYNGYIALTIAYRDTSNIMTESILRDLSNCFTIKVPHSAEVRELKIEDSIKYDESLDLSSYNHVVGTKRNPYVYSSTLIIDNLVPAGSRIEFKQPENCDYKWAVNETSTTVRQDSSNVYKDSGWKNVEGTYITSNDCYLFLLLANKDNSTALTEEEMQYLYTQFTVIPKNQINNLYDTVNTNLNVNSVNHRGYNIIAPENTLSAYKLSKKMGFDMVETDISFTSDNVPVCLHDATIDRTSNGTGNISDLTFEQVRTYDFGSWKSADYEGELIPSFEEFILLCKNLGLHPYIELKNNPACIQAQVENLVDIVKRYGMKGKVTWISFSLDCLTYIKNYDNKARLGYVVNTVSQTVIDNCAGLKTDYNEVFIDSSGSVTDEKIQLCIDNDIPLEVWTMDSDTAILSMNSYISGVTSNYLRAGQLMYNANKV